MSTRLVIGDLSFSTSAETIRATFESFGTVSDDRRGGHGGGGYSDR